jgi:glutathione S-transferase
MCLLKTDHHLSTLNDNRSAVSLRSNMMAFAYMKPGRSHAILMRVLKVQRFRPPDGYVYPTLVWAIYVERVSKPSRGGVADEMRIAAALPKAVTCLTAIADLMGDAPWLGGSALTLADLHAAPMFEYFLMAQEGREMIKNHPNLASWWSRMAARPSMWHTKPAT